MPWSQTIHTVLEWAIMSKLFLVTPLSKKTELLHSPPVTSLSCMPEWYKKIPTVKKLVVIGRTVGTNIKHCTPFLEAMTAGYMVVLSDDVLVDWENGVPSMRWRTTNVQITEHSEDQYRGVASPHGYFHHVMKWANDFHVGLPDGYSLWCTHPSNRYDLPFQVISGFVDADTYPLSIQFPFFLREGWSGIIESGTPLAQLIPIKRDDWEMKIKKCDEELADKAIEDYFRKLVRSYKNRYWHKKSYK